MGRLLDEEDANHFVVKTEGFDIEYIYKPNGGLYTGYNTAYATIQTELCVCIDSDDYMPDDAVEKILKCWHERGGEKYAGLLGLDYNIATKEFIGGTFPEALNEVFFYDLHLKKLHAGDTKPVLRTALMKAVTPQVGFLGEKNFNPVYMMLQVCDKYPVLLMNENLCNVEYQIGADSMSQGIWRQYVNSARSFAKLRLLEMGLMHNTMKNKIRVCIHYISSCLLSKDVDWLRKNPLKLMTIMLFPVGLGLYLLVLWKSKD
jgi:glycosyltransferase involved in cell wall biosynthesis